VILPRNHNEVKSNNGIAVVLTANLQAGAQAQSLSPFLPAREKQGHKSNGANKRAVKRSKVN